MNVFVDRTEWNLEDLDYIPAEKLFSKNKKYKKMVNKIVKIDIVRLTQPTLKEMKHFSW